MIEALHELANPAVILAMVAGVTAWALSWWGGADGIALLVLALRGGMLGLIAGALLLLTPLVISVMTAMIEVLRRGTGGIPSAAVFKYVIDDRVGKSASRAIAVNMDILLCLSAHVLGRLRLRQVQCQQRIYHCCFFDLFQFHIFIGGVSLF